MAYQPWLNQSYNPLGNFNLNVANLSKPESNTPRPITGGAYLGRLSYSDNPRDSLFDQPDWWKQYGLLGPVTGGASLGQDLIRGLPEAGAPNLLRLDLDDRLDAAIRDMFAEINNARGSQRTAVKGAMDERNDVQAAIDALFSGQQAQLLEMLPQNMYSDELVEENKRRVFDEILGTTNSLLSSTAGGFSRQGIRGGGPVSNAVANIQGHGIDARAQAFNDILNEQQRINTQIAAARESLSASLASQQAQLTTGLGALGVELERGNVINPDRVIGIIEGALNTQLTLDDREELLQFLEENKDSPSQLLLGGLADFMTARGASGDNILYQAGGLAAGFAADLFDRYGLGR